MLKLMSAQKAERVIGRYESWIGAVSGRYLVPAAAIKAILFQEMTMIDAFDPVAGANLAQADREHHPHAGGLARRKGGRIGYIGYVYMNAMLLLSMQPK